MENKELEIKKSRKRPVLEEISVEETLGGAMRSLGENLVYHT